MPTTESTFHYVVAGLSATTEQPMAESAPDYPDLHWQDDKPYYGTDWRGGPFYRGWACYELRDIGDSWVRPSEFPEIFEEHGWDPDHVTILAAKRRRATVFMIIERF